MKSTATLVASMLLASSSLIAGPSNKECKADFDRLCEGVEFSKKNIITCLVDKRSDVSGKCGEYIDSVNPLGGKGDDSANKKAGATDAAKDKKKKLSDKKDAVKKEGGDLMKALSK